MMSLAGRGRSHVHVFGDVTDAASASMVNGCLAHAAEIDDTHVGGMLHPGAVVIPAALAVGELLGVTGRDLVTAIVVGYDVSIRIAQSVQPGHFHRGFQATSTCGVFGAAAATSKLMSLSAESTVGALGLAGSLAGGIAQFYYSGSDVKRLHAGRAAEGGVLASLMAAEGLFGPADVVEGKAGFAAAFAGTLDADQITSGLGEIFKIEEVTIKVHATSARIQASIRATLDALRDEQISAPRIRHIEVAIPGLIQERLTQSNPQDFSAAQLSLPFSVALAVTVAETRGSDAVLTVWDYMHGLNDERVRELARLVDCKQDDSMEALSNAKGVGSRVTLSLDSGRILSKLVEVPPGAPSSPPEPGEFARLAISTIAESLAIDAAWAERIVDQTMASHLLADIRPWVSAFAAPLSDEDMNERRVNRC
jgi:2-methylcitrate dehydratase PrpD